MRVFFVCPEMSSFVDRDLRIIGQRHEVFARRLRHYNPLYAIADLIRVVRSQLVFFWFASLRNLPLVLLATLLRRKQVVVVGGYEAANLPELDYGSARSPWRRALVRFMLRRAHRILAVSRASQNSIEENLDLPRDKIRLLYHGFADPGDCGDSERHQVVVTIGCIDEITWLRKGIKEFFEVAALMPDLDFFHIGEVRIDIKRKLGRPPTENVSLLGVIPFSKLGRHLCRAKVYLQPSRHESFGCAVADAMLLGCIPVVADLFALPEVVGDCGFILPNLNLDEIQAAIRQAFALCAEEGVRCRRRILTEFPEKKRADALLAILAELES